jgi:N-acetylmuramoyl-L-alanine amidase
MLTTIFYYILQVCAWFIPLYLLFLFVFKNYTFHYWNRWYLLLIGILSFILPFINYKIVDNKTVYANLTQHQTIQTSFIETENNSLNDIIHTVVPPTPQNFSWINVLAIIFIIGVIITSAKLLYSLLNIKRLIQKAKNSWKTNIAMVFTTDAVPHSSFFNYIFINKKAKMDAELDKIIYHEMQHNEKLHSVDVLFCEILKIVMWFNPFVYWYKKSLQEIHEFEVDVEMAKLYNKESYAQLLLKVASLNFNKLINTFSSTPLKTRIIMLFNPKTYPMKKLAFLLVVPVVGFLLMAYGNVKHKTITTIKAKSNPALTLVIDAGHGGADAGAVGNNVNESELALAYANEIAVLAKEAGYQVILTRNSDSAIILKNRVAIANDSKANAFISVHFNSSTNKENNGIDAFVIEKESIDSSSEKMANQILQQLANQKQIALNTSTVQKRKSGIYVLANVAAPSVLLELGYISNQKDVKQITNDNVRKSIANQIVLGINNYFSNKNQ